jgi:hypothetical protein
VNSPVPGGADKQQVYKFTLPTLVLKVRAPQPIARKLTQLPLSVGVCRM